MSSLKILIFFSFATLFLGCREDKKSQTIATDPIEFTKEGEVLLVNESGDTLADLAIEISDNDYERETGLMYRKKLAEDHGMLFIFEQEEPRGFYMKNTNIPLDLVFLDENKVIVSIAENARPHSMETIFSEVPAMYVLEINAGLAREWNLQKGNRLVLIKE